MGMTKLKIAMSVALVLWTIVGGVSVAAYRTGWAAAAAVAVEPAPAFLAAAAEGREPAAGQGALESAWNDLADPDEAKAMAAMRTLVAAPTETVPFLKEHLKPVMVDARRVAQLVRDLDNEAFAVRRKATEELEGLGEYAVAYLEGALDNNPPLDTRKRLEAILQKLKEGARPASTVRAVRAIAVLEHLGTTESRQILEALARGRTKAVATQEAEAALDRLTERPRWTRQRIYDDLLSADDGKVARAFLALAATPKETVQFLDQEVQQKMKTAQAPAEGEALTKKEIQRALVVSYYKKVADPPLPRAPVPSNETVTRRVLVLLEHIGTAEARQLQQTIRQKNVALGQIDRQSESHRKP